MKKYILLLITFIVITFQANAQWIIGHNQADELRGTKENTVYLYVEIESNNMAAYSTEGNASYFRIVTGRGIFDYNSENYVRVIIGFYESNTLIDKCSASFFVPRGDAGSAYTSMFGKKGKELANRIFVHLKTKGDIRIIATKYSGADFDLRIPMMTEDNTMTHEEFMQKKEAL